MVYKSFIDKFTTIISGSKTNTGLNPISTLVYGRNGIVSRSLLHFNLDGLRKQIEDGLMIDKSKMKHTLHITNASSIDFTQVHDKRTSDINNNETVRATSFDLIFFLIPKPFDRGKGFDYSKNYLNIDFYSKKVIDATRLHSEDGCNWFQRMNGLPWDEEGIYSNEKLSKEYDKFSAGEESIVIGRQHFDVGNENINLDVTDVVNKMLDGEIENNGIGIAFSPLLEITESKYENFYSQLTDKTNTFFEPFVETRYDDMVSDDRANFVLGKRNRLYLYCTIGDHLEDLSLNPTVTIRNGEGEIIRDATGREMTWIMSKRQAKGIYYIDLKLSRGDFEPNTMLYDTWTNIQYQGTVLDDVELDFVIKESANYFNIGNSISTNDITFSPTTAGIKEKEQIKRGDIRKLVIQAKPSYTNNTAQLVDSMDLRLYVKDGTREIDVIEWDRVNKAFLENYYMIDTNILIPQRYFVDIRIKYGMNSIIHHDVLQFDIVDDLNNKYA